MQKLFRFCHPEYMRYRVYRRQGKIQRWEAVEDKWQPYSGAETK